MLSLRRADSSPRPQPDIGLFVSAVLLVLIATAVLYSALRGIGEAVSFPNHVARVFVAALVAWAVYRMDYRRLARFSPMLFAVALGLAAFATVAAGFRAGTRRWLDIGPLTLQPGEMAKLSLVLLLAWLIGRSGHEPLSVRSKVGWFVAAAGLVLAVAAQPDLGSAAILAGVGVGMVFLGGLRISWSVAAWGAAAATLAAPLLWFVGLRDYQRVRILAFLNPESDPLGAGYQSLQASIAVGSGGLTGAGWLRGSQTEYEFLPAPHTDFVFAVLAEEFGFVGVVVVIGLYVVLGFRLLSIAASAADNQDPLGALLVGGLFLMIHLQAAYNIAMVAGLVPIKGFPLPLMSYGGNSLLITGAAIGLAGAVKRRHWLA